MTEEILTDVPACPDCKSAAVLEIDTLPDGDMVYTVKCPQCHAIDGKWRITFPWKNKLNAINEWREAVKH